MTLSTKTACLSGNCTPNQKLTEEIPLDDHSVHYSMLRYGRANTNRLFHLSATKLNKKFFVSNAILNYNTMFQRVQSNDSEHNIFTHILLRMPYSSLNDTSITSIVKSIVCFKTIMNCIYK